MKRIQLPYLILILMFTFSIVHAQKLPKKIRHKLEEARELFGDYDYPGAVEKYKQVLKYDSSIVDAHLGIAEVHFRLKQYDWSEKRYRILDQLEVPHEETRHYYQYAEALYNLGKYPEALEIFQTYQLRVPSDTRAFNRIYSINHQEDFYQDSARYRISIATFNSPKSDFGPAAFENGITFLSSREEVKDAKTYNMTNSAYLDVYFSELETDGSLGTPVKFDPSINSPYHEGPITFYQNFKKMILTRNNYYDKKTYSNEEKTLILGLFYSEVDAEGNWAKPEPINLGASEYSNGHPAISEDGSIMFFISDRPGGLGGTDIYRSEFIDGAWSEPVALGEEINTPGDEAFPYHPNDSTLYFSSDGHKGLGGLDIYQFNLNTRKLENLGYPMNSKNDDFGLLIGWDTRSGYLSSNRDGMDNIYQFRIEEEQPEETIEEEDSIIVEEVYYTVQILALLNPETVRKEFLQDLTGVQLHIGKDGFNRYTFGRYDSAKEADEVMQKMRAKGYYDAFIRKVERYKELSKQTDINVEELYKQGTKASQVTYLQQ